MHYYRRAMELEESIVNARRHIHQNAEAGMVLPMTKRYLEETLCKLGVPLASGGWNSVSASITGAQPGGTILLRSDMDGLPMEETSGLPFASKNGCAHTCGHDMHAAMLLGAAMLLEENKDQLKGTVKLVFQPGEELFEGARKLVEEGALKNPDVNAAIGFHVDLAQRPGVVSCGEDYISCSHDAFEIQIRGRGAQGSAPEEGIDPIGVGSLIYQAFDKLSARETAPGETVSLTIGQFSSGSTGDILPETAVLRGTLRTANPDLRGFLLTRMKEIVQSAAKMAGAEATLQTSGGIPSIYNDPALRRQTEGWIGELAPVLELRGHEAILPSDDFSLISSQVPSIYLLLGARNPQNQFGYHHPAVTFNEDALVLGAATLAHCAHRWLDSREN